MGSSPNGGLFAKIFEEKRMRPGIQAKAFDDCWVGEPNSGCWLWTEGLGAGGYGTRWDSGRQKQISAHRVSFERTHGEIPKGFFVCHHCDVPTCVNPQHLFLGKPSDNSADMISKKRQAYGERHHKARLVEGDIVAIRAANGTAKTIANQFGVSRETVSQIRNKRVWRHVS